MLKRLVIHTSNYGLGSLAVTLASFISFPIFTRVFSVDEYGVLNLISASLMLLVGIAKLGVQHAVVRFYAEIKAGRRDITVPQFYATVVFGMTGLSLLIAAGWAVVSQAVPDAWWNDPRVAGLLLLTAVLVAVRTTDSGLLNILRAQERSGLFSAYSVLKKYAGLGLILVTLFFVSKGLYGFYLATIVAEVGAVAVLAAVMFRGVRYAPRDFSPGLFRSMLVFGIPMIGYELAGTALAISDRYLIQGLLGSSDLGIYAAGYNLCEYVQLILVAAIGQAIMPMYVRTWEEKGVTETARFIQSSLHYYLLLGLPVVAGLSAVGEDLLVLLASEKFRASAGVIPYIIAGLVLDGMVVMVGAGLYIHKRTVALAALVVASTVLNVVLNLILIPKFGLVGAAAATLIAYLVLVASIHVAAARHLPIVFPWASLAKFGVMAVAMYLAVSQVRIGHDVVNLVVKVVVGGALYALLVVLLDRQARGVLRTGLGKLYRVGA
ncbi:polysaccharide biosynthesis protein [Sulfurifustis variabilis]|uniref:Polysaccharide biosynthesis protein n=1 Tax=Sulfurifustis variabilis TaxID=1675686 RepID=A0A1B4V5R1_9GAMM|nr:oligosaccharide flippase family protein [Sulfurifustis variabilis]BAU47912.1 polysaccharide biosynthesis protein [Sulfurifustis variabilis]